MKITFKRNYEEKLNANTYLAILPFSQDYKVGNTFDVYVATKLHHQASILYIRPLSLEDISQLDFLPLLDVGLSADQYIQTVLDYRPDIDLSESNFELIVLQKVADKTNEKIAIFCRYYESYAGHKYKISRPEIGMIKRTEVSEPLIKKFFESKEFWAKIKSVSYYCKNINEIKRLTEINANNLHPNHYDAEYMKKLTGPEISDYYKHLRSLGLVAKKNAVGTIIDWVKSKY